MKGCLASLVWGQLIHTFTPDLLRPASTRRKASRRPKATNVLTHTLPQDLLWRLQKMQVRRPDAHQAEAKGSDDGSPESLPSGRQSRLAMPRDWRSTLSRRRSENPGGSSNGSGCRKEQRQAQLEMDGEWYADARDSAASRAEKVCTRVVLWNSFPGVRRVECAAQSLISLFCYSVVWRTGSGRFICFCVVSKRKYLKRPRSTSI